MVEKAESARSQPRPFVLRAAATHFSVRQGAPTETGPAFPPAPESSTTLFLSDASGAEENRLASREPRWLRDESKVAHALRSPQTTRVAALLLVIGLFVFIWPHVGRNRMEIIVDATGRAADVADSESPSSEVVKAEMTLKEDLQPEPTSGTDLHEVCGESCRFLFTPWIGGQETRAQEHLYRWGLVALAMNRTLVLPNVSHSKFGVCQARPFTFFYKEDALSSIGIPTVTQEHFRSWLAAKRVAATGQMLGVEKTTKTPTHSVQVGKSINTLTWTSTHPCAAAEFRIDYSKYEPTALRGFHDKSTEASDWLVHHIVSYVRDRTASTVRDPVERRQPDVVTVAQIAPFWKSSTGGVDLDVIRALNPTAVIPSQPFARLPYAKGWADMTTKLASDLGPFVAVHWRTEQLPPANLVPCAKALMKKLSELKRRIPALTSVYIATDYPWESLEEHNSDLRPHSGSYHIPKEAHRAFRRVYEWFQSGSSGLRQTSWSKEEPGLKLPVSTRVLLPDGVRLRELDLSLLGMVDKAVLMQSDLFLAGAQGQCGKRSSWTASVATARRETLQGEGEFAGRALLNEADFWGI